MNRRLAAVLLACTLIACGKEAPAPVAEKAAVPRPPEPDYDGDNLLSLAYGGAVVSRTGEQNLDVSAVHAIDGFLGSTWVSSPGSPQDTIVFSLLAPSLVTQVGVTPVKDIEIPEKVRFEASTDGKRWSELAIVEPKSDDTRQLVPVKETRARFIRVGALDQKPYYVRVRGFHALGREIEPPQTPSFGGCWTVNGWPAQITQDGARVTGVIAADTPIYLDGGTDNRVAMVMWMQGSMWGYAALTRTPDGSRLTGLRFFEEIDSRHVGEGWFGERCTGTVEAVGPAPDPSTSASLFRTQDSGLRTSADFLRRTNRYSAYGLVFDRNGRILEELSRPALDAIAALRPQRIVVHEFRLDSPAENLRYAQAKADTLRTLFPGVAIDAKGSVWDGPPVGSALQRLLASRVDIIAAL